MNFDKKKIPFYKSGVISLIGVIVNMFEAIRLSIWWHDTYDTDGTIFDIMSDTLNNFIGEWMIIDLKSAVFTLSLIVFVGILIKNCISRIIAKKHSPEKAAQTGRKVWNVLFVLSFLPFVFLVGASVVSSFAGVRTGLFNNGPTVYGFDAFRDSFVLGCLAFCVVPIFPAMLILQIVHIVKKVRAKCGQ